MRYNIDFSLSIFERGVKKVMTEKRYTLVLIGLLGIIVIELTCLAQGINGNLTRFTIGTLAGLIGYFLGRKGV